jgi:hypothetical protein
MSNFHPPIASRETEELIFIAHSLSEDWQPEAIAQAKAELERRGVTPEFQEEFLKEWERDYDIMQEKALEERRAEDFDLGEKLFIIIKWPKALFSGWDLRKEGYELKARRRPRLIALGVLVWIIFGFCVSLIIREEQRKKSEEIRNTPLTPGLEEYYERQQKDS